MTLVHLIFIAGVLHFGLLIASGLTPGVLKWKTELQSVSALSRHVIWVHGAFIVLVIVGFGLLSLFDASHLADGTPLARSVSGFIAAFWLARLMIQLFLFDAKPYLTNWVLRLGYHGLTVLFTYFFLVYGWAALFPFWKLEIP
ncbi:MAG TPA: hypothetical protein VLJ39_03910 [Tepidisphaeraceae bacterium]|nr:hypothetical protein [Tepidisphaeraceae bacterium]